MSHTASHHLNASYQHDERRSSHSSMRGDGDFEVDVGGFERATSAHEAPSSLTQRPKQRQPGGLIPDTNRSLPLPGLVGMQSSGSGIGNDNDYGFDHGYIRDRDYDDCARRSPPSSKGSLTRRSPPAQKPYPPHPYDSAPATNANQRYRHRSPLSTSVSPRIPPSQLDHQPQSQPHPPYPHHHTNYRGSYSAPGPLQESILPPPTSRRIAPLALGSHSKTASASGSRPGSSSSRNTAPTTSYQHLPPPNSADLSAYPTRTRYRLSPPSRHEDTYAPQIFPGQHGSRIKREADGNDRMPDEVGSSNGVKNRKCSRDDNIDVKTDERSQLESHATSRAERSDLPPPPQLIRTSIYDRPIHQSTFGDIESERRLSIERSSNTKKRRKSAQGDLPPVSKHLLHLRQNDTAISSSTQQAIPPPPPPPFFPPPTSGPRQQHSFLNPFPPVPRDTSHLPTRSRASDDIGPPPFNRRPSSHSLRPLTSSTPSSSSSIVTLSDEGRSHAFRRESATSMLSYSSSQGAYNTSEVSSSLVDDNERLHMGAPEGWGDSDRAGVPGRNSIAQSDMSDIHSPSIPMNDLPSHESSSKSSSPSRAASKRGPKPTTLRKLPPSTRTAVTTSGDNHAGYSRSPELRESHKIAERKRRKDMKEMFDELQDVLPYKRLPKHSKSDILTQCVDYIKDTEKDAVRLRAVCHDLQRENDMLREHMQENGLAEPSSPKYRASSAMNRFNVMKGPSGPLEGYPYHTSFPDDRLMLRPLGAIQLDATTKMGSSSSNTPAEA